MSDNSEPADNDRPKRLALVICKFLRSVGRFNPHQGWVTKNAALERLTWQDETLFDVGLAYAESKGWIVVRGEGRFSFKITDAGEDAVAAAIGKRRSAI